MEDTGHKEKGFSLIELAISLLIVSLALIPVILMLSDNNPDNLLKTQSTMTQERLAANNLMENAIAKSPEFMELINKYNVPAQKNLDTPIRTEILQHPGTNIYYRWIFKNLTYSGKGKSQILPDGNYLVEATVEIFTERTLKQNEQPSFIMGTKVLIQEKDQTFREPLIGIMILIDATPSMSQSFYKFGMCPMLAKTHKKPAEPGVKDFPQYTEETTLEQIVKDLSYLCSSTITYGDSFAFPYLLSYTDSDDLIFGWNHDNPETEYDEKYIPPLKSFEAIEDRAVSYVEGENLKLLIEFCNGNLKEAITTQDKQENQRLSNLSISRIEMLRSTLLATVKEIEEGKAGNPRYYRIGAMVFSHKSNPGDLLPLQTATMTKKYPELKKYLQSINREGAPYKFQFSAMENKTVTTDIEGALKEAHKELLKYPYLTHRIILVLTDWNMCKESTRTVDTAATRTCLTTLIKKMEERIDRLNQLIAKQTLHKKNFKPEENKLSQEVARLNKTLEVLEERLGGPPELVFKTFPLSTFMRTQECIGQEHYIPLEIAVEQVSNGTTTDAKNQKTDVYLFGLIDASYAPTPVIFHNAVNFSPNGESLTIAGISTIMQFKNYIMTQLHKTLKVAQSERYQWEKNRK